MSRDAAFQKGDHVRWDGGNQSSEGTVVREITSETIAGGRKVTASEEEPQYEVKSEKIHRSERAQLGGGLPPTNVPFAPSARARGTLCRPTRDNVPTAPTPKLRGMFSRLTRENVPSVRRSDAPGTMFGSSEAPGDRPLDHRRSSDQASLCLRVGQPPIARPMQRTHSTHRGG
jgi:hypothetical protein